MEFADIDEVAGEAPGWYGLTTSQSSSCNCFLSWNVRFSLPLWAWNSCLWWTYISCPILDRLNDEFLRHRSQVHVVYMFTKQFVDRFYESADKELPELSNTFSICKTISEDACRAYGWGHKVLYFNTVKIFLSKRLFTFEGTTTCKAEVHIRDLVTWWCLQL